MNEKIRSLLRRSGLPPLPINNDIFLENFAQLIAEDCAATCEELGTATAGTGDGSATSMADNCAEWIRKDYGIKEV